MAFPSPAARRLRTIVAGVHPQPAPPTAAGLSPVACAQRSITEMEGQVFARERGNKVVIYAAGERGVSLGEQASIKKAFLRGSLEVAFAETLEELRDDTDIIVTTGAPIGRDVIAKCPKLLMVAVAFTGTDHVDLVACREKGIAVTNIPDYATESGAQLTLALVLDHMNRPAGCHAAIQAGRWTCPPQQDLQSKKIGIVGTGSLGVRCAELFKAFQVKGIIGYDEKVNPAFKEFGGTYTPSLAALVLDADIIVICLPLTEQTRGIFSPRILELLQPQSLLVNVGRGAVVDEDSLATFLREGRFKAALDVFGTEPLPRDHPLRSVSSEFLTMTPHVGYQTAGSLDKRFEATVRNILAFLAGQAINIV